MKYILYFKLFYCAQFTGNAFSEMGLLFADYSIKPKSNNSTFIQLEPRELRPWKCTAPADKLAARGSTGSTSLPSPYTRPVPPHPGPSGAWTAPGETPRAGGARCGSRPRGGSTRDPHHQLSFCVVALSPVQHAVPFGLARVRHHTLCTLTFFVSCPCLRHSELSWLPVGTYRVVSFGEGANSVSPVH